MAKSLTKVAPRVTHKTTENGKDSNYTIKRRNRFWEVVDSSGTLVCMTVYKCGAKEVVRRLDICPCDAKYFNHNAAH